MAYGFLFAVLTGVFFGLQGTFGKFISKGLPASFLTWATFAFTAPFVILLLTITGIPEIGWAQFSWSTLTSFVVNVIAWNLFFRALSASPLYLTMPFTAFTPLFLIPMGFIILGELPGVYGLVGILLIISGAYAIHLQSKNIFQPLLSVLREKGSRFMLVVAAIWSISSSVEKVAILNSSPQFYAVIIHLLLGTAYFPVVYFRHRHLLQELPHHLLKFFIMGAISGLLVIFQFTALIYLDVSYVIAFKRAGVIVSVFLGFLFFGESKIVKNLIATTVIVSGALFIILE